MMNWLFCWISPEINYLSGTGVRNYARWSLQLQAGRRRYCVRRVSRMVYRDGGSMKTFGTELQTPSRLECLAGPDL